MRMDGCSNYIRGNKGRPYPYAPISSPKIFSIIYNEDTQRKECRISKEGIPGSQKEILGSSHMGKRIFCKHSGYRFGDNTQICAQSTGRRTTNRTTQVMARRWMTMSGTVEQVLKGFENHRRSRWWFILTGKS